MRLVRVEDEVVLLSELVVMASQGVEIRPEASLSNDVQRGSRSNGSNLKIVRACSLFIYPHAARFLGVQPATSNDVRHLHGL